MIRNLLRFLAFAGFVATVVAAPNRGEAQAPFSLCSFAITAAGVSNNSPSGYCPVDPGRMTNGAGVALLLNFSSGAVATVSVQVTGDSPINVTGGGLWNNHDTLINETASVNGNLQFPVTGVRLNATAYTSGTITLTVIQGAIPKG